MLQDREIVFPREKCTNWLSNTKLSSLKICIEAALYKQNRLYFVFMYLYVCIYIWAMNLKNSKEGYVEDFGRSKGKEEMMQF